MQSLNHHTMEFIKECHIQLHSSNNVLPYKAVNDGETFGLFTIALKCAPMREGPFHFFFTIDTTLSMTEKDNTGITKMEYMKKTLIKMLGYLENLDPQIYVTIYTFNEISELFVNNILLSKSSVQFMEKFINDIVPDNSTNIQIALETANIVTEKIQNDFPDRQLAHIFMTDGDANVGITNPNILAGLINTSLPNVFIGFGKDHNSNTLRRFSECKNCEYYFVDNLENSVLVYAESIHNILSGVFYDVEFHISNGELYDFQKNEWTNVLYENVLASESNKFYQLRTSHPEEVEVYVICGVTTVDIGTPIPDLCDENDELILTDLTKYAYRKKVQELLFLVKELSEKSYDDGFTPYATLQRENTITLSDSEKSLSLDNYSTELPEEDIYKLETEIRDVFKNIRQYMIDNKMMDDPLLSLLCEDLYVTIKTMDLGIQKNCMYVAARQTSQGRQRSYNVGSSIPETMEYDKIPRLVRSTNDPYDFQNYTLDRNTTTCFTSPTMMNTFRELQGTYELASLIPTDITSPIGSQSPISQDLDC